MVVIAGAVFAWSQFSDSAQEEVRLRTTKVARGDFVSKVQATGTLEPQELVDVGAQVTGEILEFGTDVNGNRVDYGSEVKAGQLLARIDDTIVELAIRRAEASVAQAKAQIQSAEASVAQSQANNNKAQRDLERAKKLGVGDALSQMDYDQYVTAAETSAANLQAAQAQIAQAKAQLQSAEAQLESELRNRDYTRIETPVDGTIIVRQVNVGQTVVSSMNATTLFLVARDLTKMQIWASVNEADIAKVHPGQEVRYTVDALPNETFTGTVNKIRPNATMSSNVVTYIVEIDIENPDRKLLPYMSANANFIVDERKDVLLLDETAFTFTPTEEMIAEPWRTQMKERMAGGGRGPRPEGAPAGEGRAPEGADSPERQRPEGEPAMIWKKQGEQVVPVRVRRLLSDGTRSVVQAGRDETLNEGDEIVTGIMKVTPQAAAADTGGNSPFGMQRPKRRERSTGGAAPAGAAGARGGQGGPGGPGGPR